MHFFLFTDPSHSKSPAAEPEPRALCSPKTSPANCKITFALALSCVAQHPGRCEDGQRLPEEGHRASLSSWLDIARRTRYRTEPPRRVNAAALPGLHLLGFLNRLLRVCSPLLFSCKYPRCGPPCRSDLVKASLGTRSGGESRPATDTASLRPSHSVGTCLWTEVPSHTSLHDMNFNYHTLFLSSLFCS